jgi:Zn-dependent protease/predicted transcriptional regulator
LGKSVRIGKIFGIPIRVDFSWLIGFILFAVMLSTTSLPGAYPNWDTAYYWIVGVTTIILLFGSVLIHELAHSIVSRKTGIAVKNITLFIFGGIAQIDKEAAQPKIELAISIAGPASSALLAGIFYGIAYLCNGWNVYLFALTSYLSFVNLVLAAFNMTPGFPLDGGRVLRAVIWLLTGSYLRATKIATTAGSVISIAMIAAGASIFFIWGYFDGLWLIFIGFIINGSARSSYQQTIMRENLKGYSAQDVMSRNLPTIPRNLNLMDMIEGILVKSNNRLYLVTDGESIVGTLTRLQVKKVPQRQWSLTTVSHIMIPVENLKTVRPADDASSIIEKFDQGQDDVVAVSNEGKIVGIIARHTLFDFAQRLQVLKG